MCPFCRTAGAPKLTGLMSHLTSMLRYLAAPDWRLLHPCTSPTAAE